MSRCQEKVAYPQAWMARQALRRHPPSMAAMMRVYRCQQCGQWHLGHPRQLAFAKVDSLLRKARCP